MQIYMRRMGGWVLNTLAFCHEDIQVLFVHSASVAKQFLPDQFPTPCSPHSKSATQDQEALFSSSVPHFHWLLKPGLSDHILLSGARISRST
ncbi:Os09g0487150 [Oryza sativa Japonica Group]|uniref:Os09g0487150 protein n=1 Tax=Oryza sativa subsp. japonica TaxID=39947 RepID=A0A0P0XNF5_ORYSJ|nr:hypothetical protein EE612_048626 [Oryza sativa]BAT08708.1 Os09g0487150 [Oryza sativa Japonica Group]